MKQIARKTQHMQHADVDEAYMIGNTKYCE